MGRPTTFNQELADEICNRIATGSNGLRTICNELKISISQVIKWLGDEDKKEFTAQYARAREAQADLLADEIIELADEELPTTERSECLNKDGSYTTASTKDNYNRTRLMIDARKWKASKLAPKKYGDKLDVTSGGEKMAIPVIQILPPSET